MVKKRTHACRTATKVRKCAALGEDASAKIQSMTTMPHALGGFEMLPEVWWVRYSSGSENASGK